MKTITMRVELSNNDYANIVCALDDKIEKCRKQMCNASVTEFYCYWCGRLVDLTYTREHLMKDWNINR